MALGEGRRGPTRLTAPPNPERLQGASPEVWFQMTTTRQEGSVLWCACSPTACQHIV